MIRTRQDFDRFLTQQDATLRHYAYVLDPQQGEDCYHDLVVEMLQRWSPEPIRTPDRYVWRGIKLHLANYYRRLLIDQDNSWLYLMGFAPKSYANLRLAHQPRTHCRRGHALTEANRRGKNRQCRICYRDLQREYQRKRRAALRATLSPSVERSSHVD